MTHRRILVQREALISPCGRYRYALMRRWGLRLPMCVFIMLNPSTADADIDDPTIRKCTGFAKKWGYGGYYVVNLFAYRSKSPKTLRTVSDPVGPENDYHIYRVLVESRGDVVCAWGTNGSLGNRDRNVMHLIKLSGLGVSPKAINLTQDGHPWHPLMAPYGDGVLVDYPGPRPLVSATGVAGGSLIGTSTHSTRHAGTRG